MKNLSPLTFVYFFIPLLLPLPAIALLGKEGYFASHDGLHHLYRLVALDAALRGGEIFPRVLPDMLFGYGYPVLNFYAPLSYYAAELWHLLGFGFIDSIEMTFALGLIGASLTMFLFARELFGNIGGLAAAGVYTYLPYRLADTFVRGALAESLAFVFFPLVFWALHRLVLHRNPIYVVILAVSLALLVLTHNLSTLLLAPFALAYGLFLAFEQRSIRAFVLAALAVALAALLTAFSWLPSLTEATLVVMGQIVSTQETYRSHLANLPEAFSPFLVYRYYPFQGVKPEHPLGQVHAGLIVAAALGLIAGRKAKAISRTVVGAVVFALLMAIVSFFLMLDLSSPLWDSVPYLAYLQFPWRFHAILAFATALLAAGLIRQLPSGLLGRWKVAAALVLVVVVAGTSLPEIVSPPMLYPFADRQLVEEDATTKGIADYEALQSLIYKEWRADWIFEFLPKWVAVSRSEIGLPTAATRAAGVSPDKATAIVVVDDAPLRPQFVVATPSDFQLKLHSFYFPGWQAYVDGASAGAYPSSELGLVTVDVPKGEHNISLRLADSPVRNLARAISLIGVLMLALLGAFLLWRWRRLAASGVLAIALVIVVVLARWPQPASAPMPLDVSLGDKAKLVGYTVDQLKGGKRQLDVELFWLSLAAIEEDYKVFVHLVTEDERERVAQKDSQPVFNYSPTTRWEAGEFVRDRYSLDLSAVRPGRYKVFVGMYGLKNVKNLPLILSDGSIKEEGRLLLSEVNINESW